MNSLRFFFLSRYNVISIAIVSIMMFLLYYFFLDISSNIDKNNAFFHSNITSILSFSFYISIFYKLFNDGCYRLIAINFTKTESIRKIFTDILIVLFVGIIFWSIIYVLSGFIYYGYFNLNIDYILKHCFYFILFQLFLTLLAYFLISSKTSFWTIFMSIAYLFFEDSISLMNKDTFGNYLPKETFVRLFTENSVSAIIISLVYISVLSFLIYRKNYKTI